LNSYQPTRREFLGLIGLWIGLQAGMLGAQEISREYQLKAVFLYRFTQFVDWPATAFPSPDSPIIIGVLGGNPFGEHLRAAVRDERVHNRRLIVQEYQRSQEAKNCHLLFISAAEAPRLEKTLAALKGGSILTVGEPEGFVLRGGMIQFVTEQNRIRFRINLQAARAANLQISSKLLELAEVVDARKQ